MFEQRWFDLVGRSDSLPAYKTIVEVMFDDGVVTVERLRVLELYTTDVCEKFPHIADAIQTHYQKEKRRLDTLYNRRHLLRLCQTLEAILLVWFP